MNCINCGKMIASTNKRGLCKECCFKKKYPKINFDNYNQFIKESKVILRNNGITYEKFSDLSGYEYDTVKNFFSLKFYSKEFLEVLNQILEQLD